MDHLRDACRAARSTPVVSSVAALSLALGIGANTAIFSILNSLLLKSLPVRSPSELVVVDAAGPGEFYGVGYPIWREMRDRNLFDQAFAWGTDRVAVSDTGEKQFAEAIWASGKVFEVLGISAMRGRTFDARDDLRGGGTAGPVAVIGHAFWQRRFGGTAETIGRTLTIEGVGYTVVGIMPPKFFGLNVGSNFDVMLPLETEPLLGRMPKRLDSPLWTWLHIMARRSSGQTSESLTAALANAQPRIREVTLPAFARNEDRERYLRVPLIVRDAPGGASRPRRQYGPALLALLGIVGVVLLVACANIATLMLARSTARRYEFSVRLALGASRARLARQLLTESLMLSAAGAALGLVLAHWTSRVLVAQLSTWASTAFLDLSPDARVLAVTALTTVATAILFGTLPAYCSVRVPAVDALKGSPGSLQARTLRLTSGLVIGQIALSLVLVIGASLFARSFAALAYRDLGFDRNRVLVAVLDARRSVVPAAERGSLYERARQSAAALPGVERAALSLATPLGSAGVRFTPEISTPDNPAFGGKTVRILTTPVSPGWFDTFGTRLLAGRDFTDRDRAGAPDVVIVNEAFARRYFGGASPLGRALREGSGPEDRRMLEIVGLVEDAAFATVRDAIEPTLYRPLAQRLDEKLLASTPVSLSVRAASGLPPAGLTGSVGAAIGGVDRALAITFQTVSEQLSIFYVRERLLAMLSGFFGGIALFLGAIGVYGVVAYSVSQRRPEIALRMALGANSRSIRSLVLGRVLTLIAIGAAAGTLVSLWAARLVKTLLYGIDARDPLTFAGAMLVLLLVSGTAGWLPARRAARTDPAAVLRQG